MTRGLAAIAAILTLAAPAAANTVITFESLPGMSNSPGAAVPLGSQLSNQFLASDGVVFSSGAGYVAVVDHVPGCGNPCTPTPPNVIGGTAANGTLSYGTPITASFFSTANNSVKATTNFVKVLGDTFPDNSQVTLEVYGISGNFLGSITAPEGNVFGQGADFSISTAGIHSARFFSNGATVAFDNFEFGALAAVVPEPASWAMMIAGFGLAGAVARRRRERVAVA